MAILLRQERINLQETATWDALDFKTPAHPLITSEVPLETALISFLLQQLKTEFPETPLAPFF